MRSEQLDRSRQATAEAPAALLPGRDVDDAPLAVSYSDPERQLVDFFSRFGVWWDPATPCFGIDHGCISSQREGKHFMAPMARLTVWDVEAGESMFDALTESPTGYAWGFVQEGEDRGLRLLVTVAFADLDVVAVKVEIENVGRASRRLRICLDAAAVDEDWIKSVVFDKTRGGAGVIAMQTSMPTSRFQLRGEPHIDVVSGWRADFSISQEHSPSSGFRAAGESFSLAPLETRVFSLYVSAASSDSGSGEGLMPLVRKRLEAQTANVDDVIHRAQQRWAETFAKLPAARLQQQWKDEFGTDDTLTERTPPLVRGAMMILLRNTIQPQPEQGYGETMNRQRGTFPCRFSYEGFWVWDSAFQALGFAEWDLELAKENIRIMLHHQTTDGGLPMLHPDSMIPSAQPPLFSWVAMEIYEKERKIDEERAEAFLLEVYFELALWNDWWFRHRDKNGNGLCEWGNNLESGWDDSPRWDNITGPAGWNNDHGSTVYEAVDLNAYLIKDLRCLARMARVLVDLCGPGAARDWEQKADRLSQLVVNSLYDPDDNIFYDTDYVTGQPHKLLTPACLLPLWAGVPLPKRRVRDMIETYLLSPEYFYGQYPFPTVAYNQRAHDAGGRSGYWRGPIWLNIAYFMIELLSEHGYADEAREASRRILDMVGHAGLHENYNSQTGQAGDNSRKDYSWSAAMAITIATGEPTRRRARLMYGDTFVPPSIHVGFRVRDRKIYGHAKQVSIHLANRTGSTVSGTLQFSLPGAWKLQSHDAACDAEQGWIDANDAQLPFDLEPHARSEQPIRFVIPSPMDLEDKGYAIRVQALARQDRSTILGETVLRLEGPAMLPLRWLTVETAASFQKLLHTGPPFRWMQDGRDIGRSAPGLVGLLNGHLQFLGQQAPSIHLGQRDLIKHALKLVEHLPTAASLRRSLESLLAEGIPPHIAEADARELLETVVQQTRDLTEGL